MPRQSATSTQSREPNEQFDDYFKPILAGFLKNARATCGDYVVCDYPDGTKLKSCCTPSGKTYVSVARMLPPMVEWQAAQRNPDLSPILLSIYRNAFDPNNPNFWGCAPNDKATQLAVEAALVASAFAGLGPDFAAKLTSQQRTNLQNWLASCTQVAERKTNHAWFSAVNQATRLELSRTFGEFKGDENWMLEDLKALDALGQNATAEGWYSDSPDQPIYDLYNFYVFPNFPLMWSQIIGRRYPNWDARFKSRIKTFLETTPYFFAGNGSHPLMGRSLIYRWAVLSPLVLGYRQGLWPHSPGLLRRIVRKQLEYHWKLGCFDAARGKLRETFSADETPVTREPYVDNGHPYWTMLGFSFLSIPKNDPFWTAPEELLPVEKRDFGQDFPGPRFSLAGNKRTGEVRWIQARNSAKRDAYRDKYSKLVWSSHFAFCASGDKDHVPPDQALVFRDIKTGQCATRAPNGIVEGKLDPDPLVQTQGMFGGAETRWSAQLNEWEFTVVSTIRILPGLVEEHSHVVTAPTDAVGKVEILAGSVAAPSVDRIALKIKQGFERLEVQQLDNVHLIHKTAKCRVAIGRLTAPQMTFAIEQKAIP